MSKKTVLVLFGGQSSEHEVSCMSVMNVLDNIDNDEYKVLIVGITKEGEWIKLEDKSQIVDKSWYKINKNAYLLPDATKKSILIKENNEYKEEKIDVIFPVLHGILGEDGTIQGLFELAKIPYVGCGLIASSIGMDKMYTKIIVDNIGIRQAEYVAVYNDDFDKNYEYEIKKVETVFDYPVFVKPANSGSSKGVNKATDKESLIFALEEAFKHDKKVLVEEFIKGRELECAVFGGRSEVLASGVGEILAAADFYDFDAKYNNPDSKTVVNADISNEIKEKIRDSAIEIFKALDGFGLSRVDFMVSENGEVVFNEINTMPGFTGISMYPMLMEDAGISKKELVQKLIELAFER